MQNVACPGCGAPVQFKSHASVMAVCEYCKTTILKDADSVKDLGRMSAVLEDYSPIQIGTAGRYANVGFTVIGRIQLKYAAGLWSEWFVYFDDGRDAWLSDASGQYTITFAKPAENIQHAFTDIKPAQTCTLLGQPYIASDVRIADCIGGQGELPFKVGKGWQAKVADFRKERSFVTLDYSESERPTVYAGEAVTLEQLRCQLLRDDETIRDSAGKIKHDVQRLGCPACGSNVSFVPGITRQIVCPSCRAQVDTSTKVAVVLEAGHRMTAIKTTLELGAKAKISGSQYEVIGVMKRSDDEGTQWTEYLLYSPRGGFAWLIETDEGWSRTKVLDDWPVWDWGETAKVGAQSFKKLYDYPAKVVFAAGAFNWRVSVGDTVRVIEFELGKQRLAAEISDEELTWSLSTPVPSDQMRAWFGLDIAEIARAPKTKILTIAKYFIYALLIFNAIPLLLGSGAAWVYCIFAAAAIYLPALVLHAMDDS